MNKLKKLKLASAVAFSLLTPDVYADIIELEDNAVRTTSTVGKIKVTHEDGDFFVTKQDKKFSVGRENLDSLLRDITGEQLKGFTKANNYLQVTELSNGEFKLDGKVRAPGGGPWFATFMLSASLTGYAIAGAGMVTANPALIAAGLELGSFGHASAVSALVVPTP